MSTDIDSIKRKLLIKYPVFGSVIANLEIQANKDIATAGTDGKVLLYNPKFLDGLSEKQQIFIRKKQPQRTAKYINQIILP